MGISQEDQEKIFKPFYQAVDNKPGTGLGLSIVKALSMLIRVTLKCSLW